MDRWTTILVLGQFAFVGFIIWVVSRAREAKMRQRSEERSRLLERFSSSQELIDFISSEAGSRLLDSPKTPNQHPSRMVAVTMMGGIITLFIGLAFLVVVFLGRDPSGGNLIIPGVICALAGVGLLIAAGISAWLFRRAGF